MDLRAFAAALRARWWLPAVGLMVGSAIAIALSLVATPTYSARVQFFVSTTDSQTSGEAFQGSMFSLDRVQSYARLITGEQLARRVVDDLRLDVSPGAVSGQISAEPMTDTVLIDVTVVDENPARAQQIAGAVGREFPSLVTELETPDGGGPSPIKVAVTDEPEIPTAPSSPNTTRNVLLGLAAGLLVGSTGAVVRAYLDRSVKDLDEAAAATGVPAIGMILRDAVLEKRHVLDGSEPSRAAEDYRQLRTNLQFLSVDDPPRVLMVSSALPAEGKTTLIVNLAVALAEAGRTVTIVEADLRRPKVTRYLGLVGGAGLTNVLAGTAELEDVAQRYGDRGITVVGAGPTPPNPGELLASSHMRAFVEKLRGQSDFVLVDAPPLLPVADAAGLAVAMDGVILSVRHGGTTTDQLIQAVALLHRVGARTLGFVLNMVPPQASFVGARGYGYDYLEERKRRHR